MEDDPSALFVVQTNPVPGGEDDYNEWYTNVHIPDILTVPGFVAAQRFRFGRVQRRPDASYPYSYIALYEIAGDPKEAFAALDEAVPNFSSSPMLAAERAASVFAPITARIRRAT